MCVCVCSLVCVSASAHVCVFLTVEARDGPVLADVGGPVGQFKGEGASVGVEVAVDGRDVDVVGLWLLAHLSL